MNLNFSTSYLLITLLFSSIGLGYFIYGKKQKHRVAFWTGIALMAYPNLISQPAPMVVTGLALMLIPKFLKLD